MNRFAFGAALAVGLLTVAWVGLGFVAHPVALLMTVLIAAAYLYGSRELWVYRRATAALTSALAGLQSPPPDLNAWLEQLPGSLRPAVRQRVEGVRAPLPGPALTPYLVGLLVMLGMLGTFVGMVITFQGAVFALEGSADLQAIRAALAAPIKGLGLSFGTSVAGVASSAMLGLMSTLARRERAEASRQLDARVAGALRPHSLAHQRQATYEALQQQANALPEVAHQLQALMDGLDRRSQQLGEQLLAQQAQFHQDAGQAYTTLAQAVGGSLQDALTAGARAAGDSIRPVVETTMAEVARQTQATHQRQLDATQAQLQALADAFADSTRHVAESWQQAVRAQINASETTSRDLSLALHTATEQLESRSTAWLEQLQHGAAQTQARQAETEAARLQLWQDKLQAISDQLQSRWEHTGEQAQAQHQAVCQTLADTAASITAQSQAQASRFAEDMARVLAQSESQAERRAQAEDARLALWRDSLHTLSDGLQNDWRQTSAQAQAQQQAVADALASTANAVTAQLQAQATHTAHELATLVARSDALVQTRLDAEAQWAQQQAERTEQLAALWRTELATLRQEEAARGDAAVARLDGLQAAMAQQLAHLGASLEAPMTRLLQTASEVPQAASEVIAQMRGEMTRLSERDNAALQERQALVQQLSELLQTVQHTTAEQRAAIETLVHSATDALAHSGQQLSATLDAQAAQVAEVAARVNASAVELSTLGETFGQGVQLFSGSNDKLMDSLQRIDEALQQTLTRSDEQLAYYVAQAREVIDLSITAQQGLLDDLRRLRGQPANVAEGSAA